MVITQALRKEICGQNFSLPKTALMMVTINLVFFFNFVFTRVTHNSHMTEKPVALKFPIKLNLEMLIFVEGGKPENPEKNPWSRDENQQQTQPTYDTGSRN